MKQTPSDLRTGQETLETPNRGAVVLFDGVCNLCNGSVNFIIDHDPAGYFRFASLQSKEAKALFRRMGRSGVPLESIVLVEKGSLYYRSDAVLRIAGKLKAPWPILRIFAVVPRAFRDRVYDWIARNRYRWFGKSEFCRIPTPELRDRFL